MSDQVEVRLPELAEAMTSATLAAWLKSPGDPVTAGEPIAEVETDKTTVELEAPADGVLAQIRVAAGTRDVAVGALLAVVVEGARAGENGPNRGFRPAAHRGTAAGAGRRDDVRDPHHLAQGAPATR